jgi:hypothetical protein
MAKIESPFVIPPHKYQELAQPDMCYYIIVAKEDEAKVKEAMKHYPEIEVAGYADWFMNIGATPGEVKFVGAEKKPPIRWEARRDSTIYAYINRPIY